MQRIESWDDLRYFLAVAREGGLGAASRQLGVHQSTVFRRIGRLEESLAARLFDRRPRGYALTAVGEEMLVLAVRIEDDVLALDRAVIGADRALRGTVRITTVNEVLECISPHLKSFRDRYPGIDLEVNSELRMFRLSRREADIAIRPGTRPTEPEIVGRKLVALPLAAYASPDYLSGRELPRGPLELVKHCLIGFEKGRAGDQRLRELIGDARVACRANSMSGQAIAARAGLGIALLPMFMGEADAALRRLFVVRSSEDAHLWLLIHADLRQTARVRAFVDFVAEAILADRALYEGTRQV